MTKSTIIRMIGLLGMSALLHACMQEEVPEIPDLSDGKGLTISLHTSSVHTKVTEPGEDVLRENTIEKAAVLIFEEDGTRSAGESYKELTFTGGKAVLASGDWKNNTDMFPDGPDAQYDIYVVANYHGTEDLSEITTVGNLKEAMDTDADIWKPENGNLGGTTYTGKLFTMTGSTAGFQPSAQENNTTVDVDVTRVAVKIRVHIKLAEQFGNDFVPTGFYSLVRNHATNGLLWPDNEIRTTSDERGLAGNNPEEQQTVAAVESDTDQKTATLILYTYPNRWGGDALDETFVLLNMPGKYTDTENLASNYYKIPIRLGTSADDMVLNRNTIYQTTVTIDRLGQEEIDNPVTMFPEFKVVDWEKETITIGDEDIQYLELLKDTIIMKNISETAEQYFTSSSAVASDSVEVVDVYYYDKYGTKQTIYNPDDQYHNNKEILSQYNITAGLVNDNGNNRYGYLNVTSDVPTNNGIRYIWVQVTNAQNVSAKFLVKQYPLEYITAVQGFYSYRSDFTYTVNGQEVPVEWGQTYSGRTEPQTFIGNDDNSGSGSFWSKVYNGTTINGSNVVINYYDFDENNGRWTSQRLTGYWYNTWLTNPNVYFVRITRTSDKYTLATPAIDADGYTDSSPENNALVSPAFMLASQLGAVTATRYFEEPDRYDRDYEDFNAKDQCYNYVEVTSDGTKYDDWRLPTEAELGIIMEYQYNPNSVIDEVLAGRYYWAASGNWVENTNSDHDESRNPIPAIRCIRDVKADEPIMKEN